MTRCVQTVSVLLLAAVAACGPEVSDRETRYKVALAYGLKAFDQIDQIRYTLNVRKDDRSFRRAWVWHPKADSVVYNDAFRYSRQDSALNYNSDVSQIDRWFVNDMTWLLFPLHLVWRPNLTITEAQGPQPLPTGQGVGRKMTVVFPEGGVRSGDVFDLYIGDDNRLLAWAYYAGGAEEPTEVTTWEDHRHVGPLTLSLDRRSPDGSYRVWFTDVAVKLDGMDTWLAAH